MTATDSKVRIGLAGFGLSGQGLISPFLKTDEFDVRAVLSSRTNDVRKVWPGARVVKTFDALLTDDIDLIIISTPSHLHFEQAMMALEAGKAVMAEKPLALSADECATLVRKADETGNQLTVFQNRRWDSDFLTLRKTIKEGRIGRPIRFISSWHRHRMDVRDRWRERPGPGAGVLLDLGSHLIDQALELFGAPEWVQADLWNGRAPEMDAVEDAFEVTLGYRDMRAILMCSTQAAGPSREIRLDGTAASLVMSGMDPQEDQLRSGISPSAPGFGVSDSRLAARLISPAGTETPMPQEVGNWHALFDGLSRMMRESTLPPVDPQGALLMSRVIDAARESNRTGRRVQF